MTIHVMIDGETPSADACTTSFLTLAAVPFDPVTGAVGEEVDGNLPFYYRCSLDSLKEAGFSTSADTLDWWSKQSYAAYNEAFGGTSPITYLWSAFHYYCTQLKANYEKIVVWGNGANFDNVICEQSFRKLGMTVPWSYRDNRCFRTLKELFPEIQVVYEGIKHTAVDDARNQAKHAIKILQRIEQGKAA